MKESFDEYRNIIESNIMSISYLYSGDVISSSDDFYRSFISHKKTSPKFIIDAFDYIYEKSIKSMISKSIEIVKSIDFNKIDVNVYWLEDILASLCVDNSNFIPKYVFISDLKKLGIVKNNNKKPFPEYFYDIKNLKNDCKLYKSNLLGGDIEDIVIYVVDKPIQSLVYSIQNMSYSINKNNHTLEYKFYECDYLSYKLVIKDVKKMRDDKINSILYSY